MSRIRESKYDEVITRVLVDVPSKRMAYWYEFPPTEKDPEDLSCWVLGSSRLRYGGPAWSNLSMSHVRRYLIHGDWPPRDTGN